MKKSGRLHSANNLALNSWVLAIAIITEILKLNYEFPFFAQMPYSAQVTH